MSIELLASRLSRERDTVAATEKEIDDYRIEAEATLADSIKRFMAQYREDTGLSVASITVRIVVAGDSPADCSYELAGLRITDTSRSV